LAAPVLKEFGGSLHGYMFWYISQPDVKPLKLPPSSISNFDLADHTPKDSLTIVDSTRPLSPKTPPPKP
jgi:hypothetical protein